MKGTVVALTGFVAFELAMASLLCVAEVCTLIWGEEFWPEWRWVRKPYEGEQSEISGRS
jgi:hypothetical protein